MPSLLVFVMGFGARCHPWWAAGAPCVGTARDIILSAHSSHVRRVASRLSLFLSPDGSDTLMGTYAPYVRAQRKKKEKERTCEHWHNLTKAASAQRAPLCQPLDKQCAIVYAPMEPRVLRQAQCHLMTFFEPTVFVLVLVLVAVAVDVELNRSLDRRRAFVLSQLFFRLPPAGCWMLDAAPRLNRLRGGGRESSIPREISACSLNLDPFNATRSLYSLLFRL